MGAHKLVTYYMSMFKSTIYITVVLANHLKMIFIAIANPMALVF